MSSTAGIRYVLHAVAAACITAAYLWAGHWFILPALAVLAIGWIFFRRNSMVGAARWLLGATTGLAAIAAVTNLSMIPIVVGIAAALAAWDLADFDTVLRSCARPVDRSRLTGVHMKWLGLALTSGLLLGLVASIGTLDLPFAAAAALAVVLVVSLTRAAQQLMGAKRG